MLISMTGFATHSFEIAIDKKTKLDFSISLKSLNSRFFETTIKVPAQLSNLEIEIQRLLKKELVRGHVYCTLKLHNQELLKKPAQINTQIVDTYIEHIEQIQKKYKIKDAISLDVLLNLPNIFSFEENDISDTFKEKINKEISKAIALLRKEQVSEGAHLQKDIISRLQDMKKMISKLEKVNIQNINDHKKSLENILKTIAKLDETSADYQLLSIQKENTVVEIEKMNIAEEIVRFGMHLENLKKICTSSDETKGKKIDFTLQELHREINTISAKANNATMSSFVVDIKSEVEKIKEQIQNII